MPAVTQKTPRWQISVAPGLANASCRVFALAYGDLADQPADS